MKKLRKIQKRDFEFILHGRGQKLICSQLTNYVVYKRQKYGLISGEAAWPRVYHFQLDFAYLA